MTQQFPKMFNRLMLIAVILVLTYLASAQDLIFVQQVFRHGARHPIYPSDLDGSNFTVKQHSMGQLTSQGKAMHYMLGQMLYKQYWNKLFGDNMVYNQSKFYFKSTDVNRTIESIQSQLLGLFENIQSVNISQSTVKYSFPAWNHNLDRKAGFVYEKSPLFHSLPVHVEKQEMSPWSTGDFLRHYNSEVCYQQNNWMNANKQDLYVQQIVKNPNFVNAINKVNEALGTNKDFFSVHTFVDNAQCMIHLGMEPLPIFKEDSQIKQDLFFIYVLQGYIKMFYNEDQLRATATGFFNQTVHNMKKVTNDKSGVQWIFYSAHDTSVMNFISRFGLTSVRCIYENYLNGTYFNNQSEYCIIQYPTYTSTLIFEVYEHPNQPHTFKTRYNGNYRRIPICNWEYECDVQIFYNWYESWKDEDFVKNCGIKDTQADTLFSVVMIELAVIVILLIYVIKRCVESRLAARKQLAEEISNERSQPVAEKMIQESLLTEEKERKGAQ